MYARTVRSAAFAVIYSLVTFSPALADLVPISQVRFIDTYASVYSGVDAEHEEATDFGLFSETIGSGSWATGNNGGAAHASQVSAISSSGFSASGHLDAFVIGWGLAHAEATNRFELTFALTSPSIISGTLTSSDGDGAFVSLDIPGIGFWSVSFMSHSAEVWGELPAGNYQLVLDSHLGLTAGGEFAFFGEGWYDIQLIPEPVSLTCLLPLMVFLRPRRQ